jgi:hypothetical protein
MDHIWTFKENQMNKTSPTYVAYCRAFSLLDKIRELKVEKKTSIEGPEKLLKIINTLTEGCIRKVDTLSATLSQPKINQLERKSIENTIRLIVLSVNKLHTLLRYVDATRQSRNPTGMIRPWEQLIRKHSNRVNVIIRPQWKYNYTYYNIIKEFQEINNTIKDKESREELARNGSYFPIISFAGIERDNVILHIILAHEIGHFIDEMEDISTRSKHINEIITILDAEPVSSKLEKFYALSARIMKKDKRSLLEATPGIRYDLFLEHEAKSLAMEELGKKIYRWLKEITADSIAIRIIGPSFIFALFQIDLAHVSKMGPVGDYPPPQIRMDKCIEYWNIVDKDDKFFEIKETDEPEHQRIKKCIRDYLNAIKQKEPEATPELTAISQLRKERYNLLNEILEWVVKNPIDSIRHIIGEKIPCFKLDNEIFVLIKLLRNRITPVSTKHTKGFSSLDKCDIASVLNAGWIFWLTHERELSKERKRKLVKAASLSKLRIKYYEPLVEISNLILKGIELTDFRAQFSNRKHKAKTSKKN